MLDHLRDERLCVSAIRSLGKRGIDLDSVIEPLCWVVFWDSQPRWGMERLASQGHTGHDWRSLRRLAERIRKLLDESGPLENAAGRPLDSFRKSREKLNKESERIHPSALLSPDLLTERSPDTLGRRSQFLQRATPRVSGHLHYMCEEWTRDACEAWGMLAQTGLTCSQISILLDATAEALGSQKSYSVPAVKMRLFRLSKRSL